MKCSHCGEPIAGTAADPVHATSLGTHHAACMRQAWAAKEGAEQARKDAGRAKRSAAMKTRWNESRK